MKYWLWSVNEENWPNVKKLLVWGVSKKKNVAKQCEGDYLIFYIKNTGSFQGIYKIISGWQDYGSDLDDVNGLEQFIDFPIRCKIEKIVDGDAVFNELYPKLKCTKPYPVAPQIVLRNSSFGSANAGQPLSQHDYDLIYNSLNEISEPELSTIEPITTELDSSENFDHEDIISQLGEIGNVLGFVSETNQVYTKVAKGSVVDLIWETKIANISSIRYVFEVQSKGSKKSLIDNLINSMSNPDVKKVIVVSTKKQLDEIRDMVNSIVIMTDSIKKMFVYLDVEMISSFYKLLPEINSFRDQFRNDN